MDSKVIWEALTEILAQAKTIMPPPLAAEFPEAVTAENAGEVYSMLRIVSIEGLKVAIAPPYDAAIYCTASALGVLAIAIACGIEEAQGRNGWPAVETAKIATVRVANVAKHLN